MRIIRTNNIKGLKQKLVSLASDPEQWLADYNDPGSEFNRMVVLEFPCGEVGEDGLKTIALVGKGIPQAQKITDSDAFIAQGLEGKFGVRMTLRDAILRTMLIPDYRWQIKL